MLVIGIGPVQISCADEGCEEARYEGETSRSAGETFSEHLWLIEDKREQTRQRSAFYEHAWEKHGGAVPPLTFEILGRFPDDPGLRQATEAVSIRRNNPSLNGKKEWTNDLRPRKAPSAPPAPSGRPQLTSNRHLTSSTTN